MNGSDREDPGHYDLPEGEYLNCAWLPPNVALQMDKEENWDDGHVWTIEQLTALNFCSNPIWLFCPSKLRPLWLNKSATKRFKRSNLQLAELDKEKLANNSDDKASLHQMNDMMEQVSKLLEDNSQRCVHVIGPDKLLIPWQTKSEMPGKEIVIKARLLRLSTENSKIQNVCLLQIVQELSTDQIRAVSMFHKNPLFTFMFDKTGKLLLLNNSAQQKYSLQYTTLFDLINQGIYDSGESDAQTVYNKALTTVIEKQEIFRHYIKRKSSKKPDEVRWLLLEMWPLTDPVQEGRAILVAMYNVTKLMWMQENLQRDRMEMQGVVEKEREEKEYLQTMKMKLEADNWELQQEREILQTQIEELVSGSLSTGKSGIDTETPAEKALGLIEQLLQGNKPDYNNLKTLYDTISEQKDLRQPANLQNQLMESTVFDNDVSMSMLQLLTDTSLLQYDSTALVEEDDSDKESITSGSSGSLQQHPKASIQTQLERVLVTSQSWDFDPFLLSQASEGCPLSTLGFYILKRSGLIKSLKLQEARLARFLCRIEEGYPANPYHNRIHATDVLHKTDMLLRTSGLMECEIVDQIGELACFLSAIIHDFEHKGVNNDFLVRTQDLLAIRYNDRSPLENHHLAASFHWLYTREYNFLGKQNKEFHDKLRSMMIDMVLATDMKQHFSILSRFQSLKFSNGYSLTRTRSSSSSGGIPPEHDRPTVEQFRQLEDSNRTLILQVALKMADIGHLASKKELHKKWVAQLEEEFFKQGDRERALRLQVSPLMNRRKSGITKSQVGFFDIVALPLFQAFTQIFPGAIPMLEQVQENYQLWKAIESRKISSG